MPRSSSNGGKKSPEKKQSKQLKPIDRYEAAIIKYGFDLTRRMLIKYRRGRKEHGGDPVNVFVQKEINLEVLDILNYNLIGAVNQRKSNGVKKTVKKGSVIEGLKTIPGAKIWG